MNTVPLSNNLSTSLPNFELDEHLQAFQIDILKRWNWILLNKNRLFFESTVHLLTKWRNKLLSPTAYLSLGSNGIIYRH